MSSVLDELRSFEKRVTDRLAELRPLVDEYQELERLAERLGLDATPAPAAPPRRARPPRKAPAAPRRRGTPGRKPERREQVLERVRRKPGITVPEIAKDLAVDPTGLYRVVRRLEKDGVIAKNGMELTLVG
jgi:Winged helix-turn-helix DNA-binding